MTKVDKCWCVVCAVFCLAHAEAVWCQASKAGEVKLGRVVCSLAFDDPAPWRLSSHQNQQPAPPPPEVRLRKATEVTWKEGECLRLDYHFGTPKHDAVMLTTDAKIGSGKTVGLTVHGDGSGHELFLVLVDKGGESHYLPIGPVDWKGWKTIYASWDKLLSPPVQGTILAEHWGGDKTQALELPITRLTLGLNDKPDSFVGKGTLRLARIQVFQ